APVPGRHRQPGRAGNLGGAGGVPPGTEVPVGRERREQRRPGRVLRQVEQCQRGVLPRLRRLVRTAQLVVPRGGGGEPLGRRLEVAGGPFEVPVGVRQTGRRQRRVQVAQRGREPVDQL